MGGIDPDSRRAFPWDPERWDGELLASMQASLALRHREPALRADGVGVVGAADAGLAFQRRANDTVLTVALNAGDAPVELPLAAEHERQPATVLLGIGRARTEPPTVAGGGERVSTIVLPPRSGAVVRLG
jgi:glycosidase